MRESRQIILASTSPRRKELLEKAGYTFTIVASDYEEFFDQSKPAYEVAKELALGKANAVAAKHPSAIVIGADTIVVRDGVQLGKPTDKSDAISMLRSLSNRNHEVVSGVAVVCHELRYEKTDYALSTVRFKELTDDFIERYIETGTTYDKAGGYALQHPMLSDVVALVTGEPDTVVGLPLQMVAELLAGLATNE